MDKNELHKYITYFLDGKLSAENELKLLHWIKAHKANKIQFLREQEYIAKILAEKHDEQLMRKWQNFKQRIEPEANRAKSIFIRVASIAAAFFLGALITVLVIKKLVPETVHSVQMQKVITPNGAKTNFQLPDGSIVWLNSGSELSFPSAFAETRPVHLTGQAFFEVVKSAEPFVVSTHYGEVEVQGTSFDVKAFPDEDLQATLVEGAVKVSGINTEKQVALRPGQQANLADGHITVTNVQTDIFTSWKDGKIIFRDERLPTVAMRLERWYNVKILLADNPRLKEIRYNGTLEMESFSEVLQLLKVTAPIDYSYDEKNRTIKITYKPQRTNKPQ